jgi:hypothetical protein
MSENFTWNDKSREELCETLRNLILGEVRLTNSGRKDILQTCREVYIEDDCPEDEWDTFVRFAADELAQATAKHAVEQTTWPPETDCDRLDQVEATLRERGILLWQVSPCCDNCTQSELPARIDEIEQRYPGFDERVRGYAFFIDQNMAEMLTESTTLSVCLAYGCFSPDNSGVTLDVYEKNALGIGREVCDCLREYGFEPEWNGEFSRKIVVSLNWQRRIMLV